MVICLLLLLIKVPNMKLHTFILFAILLLINMICDAQKVLLLQKPGKSKWFMYSTGDKIWLRTGEPEFAVKGTITYIDDSSCTVNRDYTFQLSKVHEVIRTRGLLNSGWKTMYLASFAYFAGSMINRGIHDEKPLIDNTVPIASGSLAALGTAALLFRYHPYKISSGWRLKVLDFDIYKQKYAPKE